MNKLTNCATVKMLSWGAGATVVSGQINPDWECVYFPRRSALGFFLTHNCDWPNSNPILNRSLTGWYYITLI
jgi:hypothetical protein